MGLPCRACKVTASLSMTLLSHVGHQTIRPLPAPELVCGPQVTWWTGIAMAFSSLSMGRTASPSSLFCSRCPYDVYPRTTEPLKPKNVESMFSNEFGPLEQKYWSILRLMRFEPRFVIWALELWPVSLEHERELKCSLKPKKPERVPGAFIARTLRTLSNSDVDSSYLVDLVQMHPQLDQHSAFNCSLLSCLLFLTCGIGSTIQSKVSWPSLCSSGYWLFACLIGTSEVANWREEERGRKNRNLKNFLKLWSRFDYSLLRSCYWAMWPTSHMPHP